MPYLKLQSYKPGILLLILLFCSSCSLTSDAEKDKTLDLDVELLQKHWIHSYEESVDENGYLHPVNGTYRPSDYNLPPFPLFIMQYKFYENGNAEYYFLAPNDGHYFKPAKWEVDNENRFLTITDTLNMESNTPTFIIKELTEDKLVLEAIE